MAGKICNARGRLPGDYGPLINQSERVYYHSHIIMLVKPCVFAKQTFFSAKAFAKAPHWIARAEFEYNKPLFTRTTLQIILWIPQKHRSSNPWSLDFSSESHLLERFLCGNIQFWISCFIGKTEIWISKSKSRSPMQSKTPYSSQSVVAKSTSFTLISGWICYRRFCLLCGDRICLCMYSEMYKLYDHAWKFLHTTAARFC